MWWGWPLPPTSFTRTNASPENASKQNHFSVDSGRKLTFYILWVCMYIYNILNNMSLCSVCVCVYVWLSAHVCVSIYLYGHSVFTINANFVDVFCAYLCVWMCVCALVCVWGCVCVSLWLLSSHVCHLLPLQVAPPRADVVDASSHPAPSPVPRYYHTTHWLMNLLDTPSLLSPSVCACVCKCPSICVCSRQYVWRAHLSLPCHYLLFIPTTGHDL